MSFAPACPNLERPCVVFILSAPYSGSTWLNAVLGCHDWAFGLGEYYRPFLVPGHVACRSCEADGLATCTVLQNVGNVPVARAFHVAAARSGKAILVDASKTLDWCERFLDRGDLEPRAIHLIRHPCGFAHSFLRRNRLCSPEDAAALWVEANRQIHDFRHRTGISSEVVSYEGLADAPDIHFRKLCHFLGETWQPESLAYWRYPHHGLGRNGAASLYLRGREKQVFVTGDDDYYASLADHSAVSDRRWTTRLSHQQKSRIMATPGMHEVACMLDDTRWVCS